MSRTHNTREILALAMVSVFAAIPASVASAADVKIPGALHIKPGKSVSFPFVLNDKGGKRWDIQTYGYIGQGTNNAMSYGNRLYVNGSSISFSGGRRSADGREIEIGPANYAGFRVSRRIRVFKEHDACRWLDIIENPSGAAKKVQLRYRTSINYGVRQVLASSGGGNFSAKDHAFITINSAGGNNIPHVLHVPCGPKSKLRPTMSRSSSSYVYMNWSISVPAHSAVVVCLFKSQGTQAQLTRRMKDWQSRPLLRDLPWSVRKLIVNMKSFGFDDEPLDVTREGMADRVELDNGDVLMGKLANPEYAIKTFYGDLTVPAKQVVGLVAQGKKAGRVLVALTDGQVVSGTLADPVIHLELPTGGTLNIPLDRTKQCGYRITDAKPEDIVMDEPLMVLRTGDRLAFIDEGLKLTLQSAHGSVDLPAGSILGVQLDLPDGGVHQVAFRNGSKLSGILGPDKLQVKLQLGPQVAVERQKVRRLVWSGETDECDGMTIVTLQNEDELIGRIDQKQLSIKHEFATEPVLVEPSNLLSIQFDPKRPGVAALKLWDGSTLRGRLAQDNLQFIVTPGGPTVSLDIARIVAIRSPMALPPKKLQAKIEKLIGRLGSEVFEERQEATAELIRIGGPARPLLKKRLNDPDPEIRQRVRDVLDRLGSNGATATPAPLTGGRQLFLGAQLRRDELVL